jgi:hypothetical protein
VWIAVSEWQGIGPSAICVSQDGSFGKEYMNMSSCTEVIQAIAVIIASVVAICGVSAWKREFVGRRRIELIEEVLALFYEAKSAIAFIRCRAQFEGEGSTRKAKEDETSEQKRWSNLAYITIERCLKREDLFNRLSALRFRFMAYFGRELEKPFLDINKVITEIMLASHALARLWMPPMGTRSRGKDALEKRAEKIQKNEEIIWWKGGNPEDDPIFLRVDNIIKEIEPIADRYMRRNIAKNKTIKTWLAWLFGKIQFGAEWCKNALLS